MKNELVGKTVMTNYGKTNYHRISDILYMPMSEVMFNCEGKEISIIQYYRERYNIDFSEKQPLLVVESSRRGNVIFNNI